MPPVPPVMPQATMPPKQGSSLTGILGAILVLAIVICGALYFWSQRAVSPATDTMPTSLEQPKAPSENDQIEADINATDVDNLDAELNAS
ncbi:hypothetical protein KW807_00080 [Candidatus Parcubacteria bacterium]|nr:hypothetical protein [Candidatus Parcubacteria bacterium]